MTALCVLFEFLWTLELPTMLQDYLKLPFDEINQLLPEEVW